MTPRRAAERLFVELGRVGLVTRAQGYLNGVAGVELLQRFRGRVMGVDLLEEMESAAERELAAEHLAGVAVWARPRGPLVQLLALPEEMPPPPEFVREQPRRLRAVP